MLTTRQSGARLTIVVLAWAGCRRSFDCEVAEVAKRLTQKSELTKSDFERGGGEVEFRIVSGTQLARQYGRDDSSYSRSGVSNSRQNVVAARAFNVVAIGGDVGHD